MRKIALIITVSCLLTGCAWNRQEKAIFAGYLTLSAIDAVQTSKAKIEYNPLLQKGNGEPDMTRIIAVKVVSGLGAYLMADYFKEYRKPILIGFISLQGVTVIYNSIQW